MVGRFACRNGIIVATDAGTYDLCMIDSTGRHRRPTGGEHIMTGITLRR